MYKADIFYEAIEDDYKQSEIGTVWNNWTETLTAPTTQELRKKVLEATYSKWEDLDDDQVNDYEFWTEYYTSYLTTEENVGDASEKDVELWRQGKLRLWAVNCHILVSEVIEKKATL